MLPLPIHKRWTIYFIVMLVALSIVTPVMADYLGPNRTVTTTAGVCKIVLNECQYVPSKNDYRFKNVDDWSCANESKPWQAYPSEPPRDCMASTLGDQYWSREDDLQTVTVTHPPATINSVLQDCTLQNGWCGVTTPKLSLNAYEPLAGYNIVLIEGLLNGQSFACPNGATNCNLPLSEGDNTFSYWALSSWGDSSLMGTFTARVDTVSPDLGANVSGAKGTDDWYVSPTTVTAVGSDAISGLASALLSVNGGGWQPSVTLTEGIHEIAFTASDIAGNISTSSSTLAVDTTTPSINVSVDGITGKNNWYRSYVQVSALASDLTSGMSSFEVSIDGGAYQNYTSAISLPDGYHTIRFKATDKAGNVTETPLQGFLIDTIAPTVDLPVSWNLGKNVDYRVQDAGSGLGALRLVIEDEDERYAKVAWNENVSGAAYEEDINWNGEFKDKTIAPPGVYLLWIKASDLAGNEHIELGKIIVPEPNLFSNLETQVESTAEAPLPPADLFGGEDSTQSTTTPPTTDFGGATTEVVETTEQHFLLTTGASGSVPDTSSNILWGSAAAAAIGAATAYVLGEQRKREEALARQAAEAKAEMEEDAKRREKSQQKQQENWEKQQALESAQPAWSAGSMDAKVARQERQETIEWVVSHTSKQQHVSSDVKVARGERDETIAWLTPIKEAQQRVHDEKERQRQAAYCAAMWQAAAEAEKLAPPPEPDWWADTKSWVNEKVIQPANTFIYQPIIKPVIDLDRKVTSWLNDHIYDPFIQPAAEKMKVSALSEFKWIDEQLVQRFVEPLMNEIGEVISDGISLLNEKVYQPYVKPAIQKEIEQLSKDIARLNEKFYQPYIQPAVSYIDKTFYQPCIQPAVEKVSNVVTDQLTWINENIYQPFFAPVINDINQYIYQPLARKTTELWNEYGEWVHGALDTVGFIPGLGEIADGINGLLYLAEGKKLEAVLSLAAMVPLVGDLGKAGKWTAKLGQELAETAAGKAAKELTEEVVEKGTKETAETASQVLVKEAKEESVDVLAKESSEDLIAKSAKETRENLVEKTAKETSAEGTQKAFRETGEESVEKVTKDVFREGTQTSTNKASKELKESSFVEAKTPRDPEITTVKAVEDPDLRKTVDTKDALQSVDKTAFISSLREKYGNEMVDRFLPFCEKYDIDPYEILTRPPAEGQTLVGWGLRIDNPANPVNHPVLSLNLTKAELNSILEKSVVRPDSKIVVLGYGKGTKKPYFKLSDEIEGCHLSLSNEDWAPFGNAQANFWIDINAPFLEKGIQERKVFLFNIEYDVITNPRNAERFSLPELRLIEMEKNNYVKVPVGKYTAFVPLESVDNFAEDLPASLFELGEEL